MKRILFLLVFILLALNMNNVFARRGCCSHHGGVAGCNSNTGMVACNDGTDSSSCTCASY